jgi:4-aminobutyrate aminotransferase-like enzyme
MATKADFTDDEWATVLRAPTVAGMAITFADPGGPIEVVKETSAVLKVITGSSGEERNDVVGEIAREILAMAKQRKTPVGDFKPKGALAGKEILDELTRASEIVDAKASPEEARAFREWIMECAQRAAEAAKEGGFMGFHAERVSQGEKDMLAQLGSALGVSAA